MSLIRLICKIPTCDITELFDSVDQVNVSGWDQLDRIGYGRHERDELVYEHEGYCPNHQL